MCNIDTTIEEYKALIKKEAELDAKIYKHFHPIINELRDKRCLDGLKDLFETIPPSTARVHLRAAIREVSAISVLRSKGNE